jgi:hypothetical protein
MNNSFAAKSVTTLILVFALATGMSSARAAVHYPWCALYGGEDSPGVPVCGFTTYRQCMASVSGSQGYCQQNWPSR